MSASYLLNGLSLRAGLHGRVQLAGSKSISNRVLIIRALAGQDFSIARLASAKDTDTMQALLASDAEVLDVGAAGTTFRFLTAYLCTRPGQQTLTGSERMRQRPIGVLVDALRQLGADITYLGQEGYPPLRIGHAPNLGAANNRLSIPASTSSQYITALLLLAPTLPQGLALTLEGTIVSRPYIDMTLRLMQYFGVAHQWEGQTITVAPQAYQPRDFVVEADWSAASYYYSMAALSEESELFLGGLFADSLQGDSALADMFQQFGVATTYQSDGILLSKKKGAKATPVFEYDFLECPDVAQTLAVTCAGLGVQGLFTGLETLRIKETDRIAALRNELAHFNVHFIALPERLSKTPDKAYFLVEGELQTFEATTAPTIATYEDHRMAMAFAPLALLTPLRIAEPDVVAKSYPEFWDDLKGLGVVVG